MALCGGDMGFSAAALTDLEDGCQRQQKFREDFTSLFPITRDLSSPPYAGALAQPETGKPASAHPSTARSGVAML